MFSNLILLILFKDISTNETQVRELLRANPVPMMITISILAPLIEELTFRKNLSPLFKNSLLLQKAISYFITSLQTSSIILIY
jgi:membrane protease YdiL (CAAX protease family)